MNIFRLKNGDGYINNKRISKKVIDDYVIDEDILDNNNNVIEINKTIIYGIVINKYKTLIQVYIPDCFGKNVFEYYEDYNKNDVLMIERLDNDLKIVKKITNTYFNDYYYDILIELDMNNYIIKRTIISHKLYKNNFMYQLNVNKINCDISKFNCYRNNSINDIISNDEYIYILDLGAYLGTNDMIEFFKFEINKFTYLNNNFDFYLHDPLIINIFNFKENNIYHVLKYDKNMKFVEKDKIYIGELVDNKINYKIRPMTTSNDFYKYYEYVNKIYKLNINISKNNIFFEKDRLKLMNYYNKKHNNLLIGMEIDKIIGVIKKIYKNGFDVIINNVINNCHISSLDINVKYMDGKYYNDDEIILQDNSQVWLKKLEFNKNKEKILWYVEKIIYV